MQDQFKTIHCYISRKENIGAKLSSLLLIKEQIVAVV